MRTVIKKGVSRGTLGRVRRSIPLPLPADGRCTLHRPCYISNVLSLCAPPVNLNFSTPHRPAAQPGAARPARAGHVPPTLKARAGSAPQKKNIAEYSSLSLECSAGYHDFFLFRPLQNRHKHATSHTQEFFMPRQSPDLPWQRSSMRKIGDAVNLMVRS